MNTLPRKAPLVVWYNTKCPVCNAGINTQQNKLLSLVKAGQVEFRDINLEPDALSQFGSGAEDVRKWLHAVEDGKLLKGADVAVALWRITPGQAWLAALLGSATTLPFARIAYNVFAEVLYAWNKSQKHW